jgi:asparagine synthase (glutamine-hydrolysing)
MCGIAGIFNYAEPERPIDRALLERMTRAVAHRGPDGEGFHVEGPIGFGHRRLAIVDLTPTGAQPMSDDSGQCWITYNGEFYNHAPFREALKSKCRFRGTSDTETLIHLLRERGPEVLSETAAIFAFAFWDGRSKQLLLARDHLGVKQVYYFDDGRRLLFASEMKALLACAEVPRELDIEALNQYLHFHTPLFERTFFKHIRQLKPAEYLRVGRSGITARQTYWRIEDFTPSEESPEQAVEALRAEVGRVVADQLMSDVPVGTFFSGGIDSTAVASFSKQAGANPRCFGVHFSDQGVIDERPFQEAAAKALGLELELITLDGSSFPDDLLRLLYFQDQPVIGPAMLPMFAVSKLAASRVKVCLGGQAADEIFAGYARYALANPLQVARNWLGSRREHHAQVDNSGASVTTRVGGNLLRQLADVRNLRRLGGTLKHVGDWRARYFENFAKVPESDWRSLFSEGVVSRASCREIYEHTLDASGAREPGTLAMHWDVQTYLPGLFQQDDRMSMANGLESRVPLADPRLVRFAFHRGMDVKMRRGASKWLLREAVADAIPGMVLNRRKVGFDTPAAAWMRGAHRNFVRDTLLSSKARQRGLWQTFGLQHLLEDADHHPFATDLLWKTLCVESWCRLFLDDRALPPEPNRPIEVRTPEPAPPPLKNGVAHSERSLSTLVQEVRELGVSGTLFRVGWEARLRSGLMPHLEAPSREADTPPPPSMAPFTRWREVADAMRERIPKHDLAKLEELALNAEQGKLLCFGRWYADFGRPIDWHRNPTNGRRWNPREHWSKVLAAEPDVGEVKFTWEAGRFPQAYSLGRAAAFFPERREQFAKAFAEQVSSFIVENPFRLGVHWSSGQEIVFRAMAWFFGRSALEDRAELASALPAMGRSIHQGMQHVEEHRIYAERAVYNNHLITEALGGLVGAFAWPDAPEAARWRGDAERLLSEQADRQFYADGGYLQQSHNYERSVLTTYLWAGVLERSQGRPIPPAWLNAMTNGLDFLVAHQNPLDGSLPNYGANDGSRPLPLTSCDFSDFRPELQAISLFTRGVRLYEPGPWDEMAAWLLGPASLEALCKKPERRSISYPVSGHHVLRSNDEGTFATFRCSSLRDRFSQIDMLHVDLFWRGLNVLVDGGSFQYNAAERWHAHFLRTESHNTVQVDGTDQMLHHRRFKTINWTQARMLRFFDAGDWSLAEGEHYGYQRIASDIIHRRAVLHGKDDLWVVIDHLGGEGLHQARLHWLMGDFSHEYSPEQGCLGLKTPQGLFTTTVIDSRGRPLAGDVVVGQSEHPRGWHSRYYGEKKPVPSLAVERQVELPITWVSILGPATPTVRLEGARWEVSTRRVALRFELEDGRPNEVSVLRRPQES